MEYINYVYYHGVLKNLYKRLGEEQDNQESLNRAIESVENRIKEYEDKPQRYKKNTLFKSDYDQFLAETSKEKMNLTR